MDRHESHDLSANPANKRILACVCCLPFSPGRGLFNTREITQQFVSNRFIGCFNSTGQDAIVPNDVEIMRRNVTGQPFDEFKGSHSVQDLATMVSVVLELKGDHVAGVIFDPNL